MSNEIRFLIKRTKDCEPVYNYTNAGIKWLDTNGVWHGHYIMIDYEASDEHILDAVSQLLKFRELKMSGEIKNERRD